MIKKVLLLYCSIFICVAQAIVVGSNTTSSKQSGVTFPASDNNNEMRGFAYFASGFTLQNSSTTCLFNSVFPVGGAISLQGGTLMLNVDLTFDKTASISTSGTIDGDTKWALMLPDTPGFFSFPAGSHIMRDVILVCNCDIALEGMLTFEGSCALFGQGHTITLGASGALNVATGGTLLCDDLILDDVIGSNVQGTDSTSTFSLHTVEMRLKGDTTFAQGRCDIEGDVVITGTHSFIYTSDQMSTIASNASLNFDSGTTFSYDPSVSSNDLLQMTDNSSKLWIKEATLYASNAGLSFTKGTIVIEGDCSFVSDATVEAEGISLGSGVSADDNCIVKILPESNVHLTSGHLLYKNV